jgi:hypothetical protein
MFENLSLNKKHIEENVQGMTNFNFGEYLNTRHLNGRNTENQILGSPVFKC